MARPGTQPPSPPSAVFQNWGPSPPPPSLVLSSMPIGTLTLPFPFLQSFEPRTQCIASAHIACVVLPDRGARTARPCQPSGQVQVAVLGVREGKEGRGSHCFLGTSRCPEYFPLT